MVHQCVSVLMCVCMRSHLYPSASFFSVSAVDCVASQRAVTANHRPLYIANRHWSVFMNHDTAGYWLAQHRVSLGRRTLKIQRGLTLLRSQCCGREHTMLTDLNRYLQLESVMFFQLPCHYYIHLYGRLRLNSRIWYSTTEKCWLGLHLTGWQFHCCIASVHYLFAFTLHFFGLSTAFSLHTSNNEMKQMWH